MRKNRVGPSTLGVVASTILFSSILCAQDAKGLIAEYDKAYREWMDTYRSASTEARNELRSQMPKPNALFPRLFALIDAKPKSDNALTAANWVITRGRAQGTDLNRATAALLNHHVQSPELARTCTSLGRVPTTTSANFLKTLEKQSPHATVRAQACMGLAELHKRRAALAQQLKSLEKDRVKVLTTAYGRETVDILKAADPAKLEKQAEACFQKIMDTKDYAEVAYGRSNLGARAKSNLYELRHLSIGKVAPEIDGEDIDGNPIKLSDYRGKVVVLDFWGDW